MKGRNKKEKDEKVIKNEERYEQTDKLEEKEEEI